MQNLNISARERVENIRTIGEGLQKIQGQLKCSPNLAKQVEELCFNQATSSEDYKKRIFKKMKKICQQSLSSPPNVNAEIMHFKKEEICFGEPKTAPINTTGLSGPHALESHTTPQHRFNQSHPFPLHTLQSNSQMKHSNSHVSTHNGPVSHIQMINYAVPSNESPQTVQDFERSSLQRPQNYILDCSVPDPIPYTQSFSVLECVPDPIPIFENEQQNNLPINSRLHLQDTTNCGTDITGPERQKITCKMLAEHKDMLENFTTKSERFLRKIKERANQYGSEPAANGAQTQILKLQQFIAYAKNTLVYMKRCAEGHIPSLQTLYGLKMTITKILAANKRIESLITKQASPGKTNHLPLHQTPVQQKFMHTTQNGLQSNVPRPAFTSSSFLQQEKSMSVQGCPAYSHLKNEVHNQMQSPIQNQGVSPITLSKCAVQKKQNNSQPTLQTRSLPQNGQHQPIINVTVNVNNIQHAQSHAPSSNFVTEQEAHTLGSSELLLFPENEGEPFNSQPNNVHGSGQEVADPALLQFEKIWLEESFTDDDLFTNPIADAVANNMVDAFNEELSETSACLLREDSSHFPFVFDSLKTESSAEAKSNYLNSNGKMQMTKAEDESDFPLKNRLNSSDDMFAPQESFVQHDSILKHSSIDNDPFSSALFNNKTVLFEDKSLSAPKFSANTISVTEPQVLSIEKDISFGPYNVTPNVTGIPRAFSKNLSGTTSCYGHEEKGRSNRNNAVKRNLDWTTREQTENIPNYSVSSPNTPLKKYKVCLTNSNVSPQQDFDSSNYQSKASILVEKLRKTKDFQELEFSTNEAEDVLFVECVNVCVVSILFESYRDNVQGVLIQRPFAASVVRKDQINNFCGTNFVQEDVAGRLYGMKHSFPKPSDDYFRKVSTHAMQMLRYFIDRHPDIKGLLLFLKWVENYGKKNVGSAGTHLLHFDNSSQSLLPPFLRTKEGEVFTKEQSF